MIIYTDGSKVDTELNVVPIGGWGFVHIDNDKLLKIKFGKLIKGEQNSYRAEAQAIAEALIYAYNNLEANESLTIYSDSLYVINAILGDNKRLAHRDIWVVIEKYCSLLIEKGHTVDIKKVKRRSNKWARVADDLAIKGAMHLLIPQQERIEEIC